MSSVPCQASEFSQASVPGPVCETQRVGLLSIPGALMSTLCIPRALRFTGARAVVVTPHLVQHLVVAQGLERGVPCSTDLVLHLGGRNWIIGNLSEKREPCCRDRWMVASLASPLPD